MKKKHEQSAIFSLLLIGGLCHLVASVQAFEESPALPDRLRPEMVRQRALPEQFSAVNAPAWADTEIRAPEKTRELIAACQAGKLEKVKKLLADGALANAADELGQRPLIAAVAGGHAEIVRLLLQAGASPRVKGPQGFHPLTLAAGSGQQFVVRLLLQAGADINARSDNRASALHEAIRFDQSEIIPILLAANPYPESFDREGLHPLALAAALGKLPALRTLLETGLDPDLPDRSGLTALYWARRYQQELAEAFLVTHGATREAWPIPVR